MIPDPLHPAVVHVPLGLAVVMPALALLAALLTRRREPRAWAWIVLLQSVLLCSVWAALETGEHEEERVESVVAESHIETHEELAERVLFASALGLALAAAGLLPGAPGGIARAATVGSTLLVLFTAAQTGHSGGELVYRHGAANAYAAERAAGGDETHARTWSDDDD